MTIRTTHSIIRFSHPFQLSGHALPQPAGDYRLDQEEDRLERRSFAAWRRIRTFIHLPAIGTCASPQQRVLVEPDELDALTKQENRQ